MHSAVQAGCQDGCASLPFTKPQNSIPYSISPPASAQIHLDYLMFIFRSFNPLRNDEIHIIPKVETKIIPLRNK